MLSSAGSRTWLPTTMPGPSGRPWIGRVVRMSVKVQAVGESESKRASRVSGTLARSRPSVNFAPPSASRTPSSTGGDSTTAKPRVVPRAWIGSTSACCWADSSASMPGVAASAARAASVSPSASCTTASTRWSSSPSRVCCMRNQPTMPTTAAESRTVLTTTRACTERRQKAGPCRSTGGSRSRMLTGGS